MPDHGARPSFPAARPADTTELVATIKAEANKIASLAPYKADHDSFTVMYDALSLLAAAARRTEQAEAWAEQLEACDCVPCIVSSKACRKCGRKATIPQEQMVRSVNELQARAEQAETERDAAEAQRDRNFDMAADWTERAIRAENRALELERERDDATASVYAALRLGTDEPPDAVFRFFQRLHDLPETGSPSARLDAALARVRDLERALRDIISLDLGMLPMDDSPAVRIARAALVSGAAEGKGEGRSSSDDQKRVAASCPDPSSGAAEGNSDE